MDKMQKVFVYGTLKKGFPNYPLMVDTLSGVGSLYAKAITVDCFPLLVKGRNNTPYVLDVKGKGKTVPGEIYLVDEQKLIKLDELEGHPAYYQRDHVDVQLLEDSGDGNGKKNNVEKCWCYFLRNFKDELLEGPFLDDYTWDHQKDYVRPQDRKDKDKSLARSDVLKT